MERSLFLISPAAFESYWRAEIPKIASGKDPRFSLPEYDIAFAEVFIDLVEDCATEVAPILKELPTKRTDAVATTHITGPEGETISFRPYAAMASWVVDVRHIVDFDFAEWTRVIRGTAEWHADAAIDHLLRMTAVVTTTFGNAELAKGETLGWPLLLKCLDGIKIDFDESGDPQLPRLVDSARKRHIVAYPPLNDDHRLEFETLMKRKRSEFDARTRRR